MRRSRRALERAVAEARTRRDRAQCWYALGLFHDNNSREGEAIPCYRQALALGLDAPTKARTLAWLASSLHKTGDDAEARRVARRAARASSDDTLSAFIDGLQRRIEQAVVRL